MGTRVLYGRFSAQLKNLRRNSMHASTHYPDRALSIAMYPASNTEHSRLSYFHRYFVQRQIPISILLLWLSVPSPKLHVADVERGIYKRRHQHASPLPATVFPPCRACIHVYTPP